MLQKFRQIAELWRIELGVELARGAGPLALRGQVRAAEPIQGQIFEVCRGARFGELHADLAGVYGALVQAGQFHGMRIETDRKIGRLGQMGRGAKARPSVEIERRRAHIDEETRRLAADRGAYRKGCRTGSSGRGAG